MSKRCNQIHEQVQQVILEYLGYLKRSNWIHENPRLLDIGCWEGVTTNVYAGKLGTKFQYGIEIFDEQIVKARSRNVKVDKVDLERDKFPYKNDYFDIIICNQVFEHLKQIFHPMDEILRTLKPGGFFVFSVPNLSSFHNRLMLLFGLQPSSIRIFGPHVRGFTYNSFVQYATFSKNYKLIKSKGVGFYPLPAKPFGNLLGNIWKSGCHTPVLLLMKNVKNKDAVSWDYSIRRMNQQTLF